MFDRHREQIYVAELRVPTCFYTSTEIRGRLPNPGAFEVNKGYYVIRPPVEEPTLRGYIEMRLVIELVAAGLVEAEDHALRVGRTFASLCASYGGYPLEFPYLNRLAHIDINSDLRSQHNYSYRRKQYLLSHFDGVVKHYLDRYLQSASSISPETGPNLHSAIHWYGISMSAEDPTVSYVAAWTGLECIGKIIDAITHPNGPKAPCQTCCNPAGKDRDRTFAGITHMFRLLSQGQLPYSTSEEARDFLADDLDGALSPESARELRHSLVHGLEEIELLSPKTFHSRRFLIQVLNASIQMALGKDVRFWIPGNYGFHPFSRHSLGFNDGLKWSPYFDEWAAELQVSDRPFVSHPGREYVGDFQTEWAIDLNAVRFVESKCVEVFESGIDVANLADKTRLTGLSTWPDRPSDLSWQEFGG